MLCNNVERPFKRIRILSSINPYEPHEPQPSRTAAPASPERDQRQEPQPAVRPSRDAEADAETSLSTSTGNDSYSSSRSSRFRFKDPTRKKDGRPRDPKLVSERHGREHRRCDDDGDRRNTHRRHKNDGEKDERGSDRHHRHRHHRRRRRRQAEAPPDPEPEDQFTAPELDPDAAFRESLFDAMADDEGAAYWQGVYGQPIHTLGADGELEAMTEDEYAAHVRAKMWEKTHAGLLEAREQRRREKAARDEERARDKKARDDAGRVDDAVDERLRRGRDRRLRRAWRERWARYCDAWARWDKGLVEGEAMALLADVGDAWPVESGRRGDVDEAGVKRFFIQCLNAAAEETAFKMATSPSTETKTGIDFAMRLKEERVRWHPDKIQQRLGGRVDEDLARDVTAVFQIVDSLWSERRGKK